MDTNKPMDKVENQNSSDSNQFGIITTSEFLNFLKLACHVHESIILKDEAAAALDYNALAKNELVNSLLNLKSGSSPKSSGAEENAGIEKNGKYLIGNLICRVLSSFHTPPPPSLSDGNVQSDNGSTHKWRYKGRFNEKSPMEALLSEKLNEVIGEGMLDSILPFICAANMPMQNDKMHISHTCGLKINKPTANNLKSSSPRIVGTRDRDRDDGPHTNRSNADNSSTSAKDRSQRRKSNQSIGLLSEFVFKMLYKLK